MIKTQHKKHIKLHKVCQHDNVEFQFDSSGCKVVDGYLVLNNPTVMFGDCSCGKYVEEIAIGGLFKLPEKVSENGKKKKNSGLKFGFMDDGLEFDED